MSKWQQKLRSNSGEVGKARCSKSRKSQIRVISESTDRSEKKLPAGGGEPMKITSLFLALVALTLGAFGAGCQKESGSAAPPAAETPASEGTIVAVGDSLTAGYGLAEADAYPAQLERKLHQAGYRWRVINAGISGETSSGTLSRVDWILKLKPDLVILETGANDGLRGVNPRLTRGNIDKTVSRLQQKGVVVVLAGMRMFNNLGPSYTKEFAAIYPEVAAKHHLILVPFFLSGVAGDAALNQADGIHPLAKGYGIVTELVYPYLLQAIDRKKSGQRSARQ
jgi:acyl-CoA thioesterase-1